MYVKSDVKNVEKQQDKKINVKYLVSILLSVLALIVLYIFKGIGFICCIIIYTIIWCLKGLGAVVFYVSKTIEKIQFYFFPDLKNNKNK